MSDMRDDDELRRLLRRADPAADAGPLDATSAERMRERIMLEPQDAAAPRRKRAPLFVALGTVVAAATAAVVVPLVLASGAADITTLEAPMAGGPAVICAMVTPEAVAGVELAFRGEVESIDGGTVTLRVTERFSGGVEDTVRLPQGQDGATDGAPPVFTDGDAYLVAANDGVVAGCGLTGPADAGLEAVYAEAFSDA